MEFKISLTQANGNEQKPLAWDSNSLSAWVAYGRYVPTTAPPTWESDEKKKESAVVSKTGKLEFHHHLASTHTLAQPVESLLDVL